MKPKAPPPQLVMSPVFWPRARILKKHWAISSINSATASALLSTIGPAAVPRPTWVLCRAIAIASPSCKKLHLKTHLSIRQTDTYVVIVPEVTGRNRGSGSDMNTLEHPESDTAGVIARPPLLFLAALVLGFIADHLLPLPFPISRISLAHWISAMMASFIILTGLAL